MLVLILFNPEEEDGTSSELQVLTSQTTESHSQLDGKHHFTRQTDKYCALILCIILQRRLINEYDNGV